MKQSLGDIVLIEGNNELNIQLTPIAPAWIYPSGYNDPDGKWINEANAYDGNLSTYAFNSLTKYGHYVEYLLGIPLNCSKVRIYALAYIPYGPLVNPNLAIDVYYENSWHNIFSGGISGQTWVEILIPAGTKIVSKARIKSNRSDAHLEIREFQFWGH